ncbi:hypothetical protein C2G38_2191840 [Gigaspora rosea]|uniref:Uncharacterized protein n=1 Tax=Gigaspora rosea TaxID=44941 RepID=A0A397V260_9GLOM|nr:hypothetical protein C2G38_2191840 [Gigaspora rosea]CAG8502802.1 8370_t:CDS:2 [Gigaspora rosea]
MPRKHAVRSKFERILRSNSSTPEDISKAFLEYSKKIQMKGLVNRISRLKNENKVLQNENKVLETENKKLFTENAQYKEALILSVEVATRNEQEYKKEISNYKKTIEEIYDQIDNIDDVTKLNSILCQNKIPVSQDFLVINNESDKICFLTFDEAIHHSKERIHKIDDEGNRINEGPSVPHTFSFYNKSTSIEELEFDSF